ncbi:MAG: hypothetical protein GX811_09375 [Lentisphaerae bacterium]|nr:hypothetical protein [Lentisphaerota bacterium]
MKKSQVIALLLICICTIILIMTKGQTDVNLVFKTIKALSSLVFLSFAVIGVVIGLLIK